MSSYNHDTSKVTNWQVTTDKVCNNRQIIDYQMQIQILVIIVFLVLVLVIKI